jgi:APA family basic amino acid/polyamine antiporter
MNNTSPKLGFVASTAVVLGNIVGVMIFLTQGTVAKHLPWNGWLLLAWGLGGLLAIIGAICLGELGAMMPRSGGDYLFIKEAWGERLAFLSGWTSVMITFPGSIAAMAVGLCFWQGPMLFGGWVQKPLFTLKMGTFLYKLNGAQLLSFVVILALTGINHIGVRLSGRVQTAMTVLPILLMLAAFVGVWFVTPTAPLPPAVDTGQMWSWMGMWPTIAPRFSEMSPWLGLWPAIVPIFFAYAGWNATTYIGDEIEAPTRNIPRSLFWGTTISVGVYLLVSWVFLQGLPAAHMPNAFPTVPIASLQRLFGNGSANALGAVIALAVIGSLNATVLAGARISYAMSLNKQALPALQHRSKRFQTPVVALWVQAALASLLVLTGRFDDIVNYVTGVMLAFSCITVASIFILRRREPQAERPWKVPLYPWLPGFFVMFCLAVLVGLCLESPRQVLWGLLITLAGLPVYAWLKLNGRGDSSPES